MCYNISYICMYICKYVYTYHYEFVMYVVGVDKERYGL